VKIVIPMIYKLSEADEYYKHYGILKSNIILILRYTFIIFPPWVLAISALMSSYENN
jgi:hypothetical protein